MQSILSKVKIKVVPIYGWYGILLSLWLKWVRMTFAPLSKNGVRTIQCIVTKKFTCDPHKNTITPQLIQFTFFQV